MKKVIKALANILAVVALIGVVYAGYVLSFQMFNTHLDDQGQSNVSLIVNSSELPADVLPTVASVTKAKVVAFEAVNIREGPSEHDNDIGDLLYGKVVNVFECQNGWARIGTNKWVKAKYLEPACE